MSNSRLPSPCNFRPKQLDKVKSGRPARFAMSSLGALAAGDGPVKGIEGFRVKL